MRPTSPQKNVNLGLLILCYRLAKPFVEPRYLPGWRVLMMPPLHSAEMTWPPPSATTSLRPRTGIDRNSLALRVPVNAAISRAARLDVFENPRRESQPAKSNCLPCSPSGWMRTSRAPSVRSRCMASSISGAARKHCRCRSSCSNVPHLKLPPHPRLSGIAARSRILLPQGRACAELPRPGRTGRHVRPAGSERRGQVDPYAVHSDAPDAHRWHDPLRRHRRHQRARTALRGCGAYLPQDFGVYPASAPTTCWEHMARCRQNLARDARKRCQSWVAE